MLLYTDGNNNNIKLCLVIITIAVLEIGQASKDFSLS